MWGSYTKNLLKDFSKDAVNEDIIIWITLGAQIPEISSHFTTLNSYSYDEDTHYPGTRHCLLTEKLRLGKLKGFSLNHDLPKRKTKPTKKCCVRVPHRNSMHEVFGTHQSKCNSLNLWIEKTRLNTAAEPWFLPERHLPGLLSVHVVPHGGSAVACSRLPGSHRLNPLMHGSHFCSTLEGQQSTQGQKQLLQFCFEGRAWSPCITDLWLWITV